MQHISTIISGACIAALGLCLPVTAFAQATKSSPAAGSSPAASPAVASTSAAKTSPVATSPAASPAASAAKAPRALPYRGTISAVDQTAKTFTIEGKEKSRVYKISDRTEITKDGNAATMADVTEKEAIRGSYWKQEDGTMEAKTVKLGAKAAPEKSSKKSKKAADDAASAASSPASSPMDSPRAPTSTKASPSPSPAKASPSPSPKK